MNSPFGSGGGGGGGKPRNVVIEPGPQQRSGGDYTINPGSIPEGGPLPFATPSPDAGNPLGAGTPGARPPFRLEG